MTPQNVAIVERLVTTLGPHIAIRHRDMRSSLNTRFILRDAEEAIFFLKPSVNEDQQGETGLWTDSDEIINALTMLHEEFWADSTHLGDRARQLDAS